MSVAALSRRRWLVAITLSAIVVITYFGFVLLIAFARPAVATLLMPGLSLGILLGALVIVVAWFTTWIYVHWANRHFDPRVRELQGLRDKQ